MTGLHLRGRLDVRATGPAALPLEFTWRGKRHLVQRLERLPNKQRGGRYQLTTTDGLRCVVLQDRELSTWHLERVLPSLRGGMGG
jgi:hypothetical protein